MQHLISVIDDDESLRLALVGLLRSFGKEASGHASVEDFWASQEIEHTRCIISDIQLPGASGIELQRRLQARENAPPVILITARTDKALLAEAEASGAICVFRKPFDTQAIMACVDSALAR